MSDWGNHTVRGEKVKALCVHIQEALKDVVKGASMAELGLALLTVYNHHVLAAAAQDAEKHAARLKKKRVWGG